MTPCRIHDGWRRALVGLTLAVAITAPSQTAPFAHTQTAGPIAQQGTILNGMLTANGLPTTAWFEWGTNKSYGEIAAVPQVYEGAAVQRVSVNTGPLLAGQVYHYRLGTSNASGVVYGSDQMFRAGTGSKLAAWVNNLFVNNQYGEASVPFGLSNIVALVGGAQQSYAIFTNGTVRRWGRIPSGTEALETALSNVVSLSSSYGHVLALQNDGIVRALGRFAGTNVPPGLSNVVAVAAGGLDGGYFSLALKADGTAVGWGSNSHGQTNIPAPATNLIAIAAGAYHGLALRSDGKVIAWGWNYDGQTNVPFGLSSVVAIAAAGFHNRVLKADGTVLAWGDQIYSPPNLNAVSISAGDSQDVALGTDGKITVLNYYGEPMAPMGLTNAVMIASGSSHILAVGNNAAPSVYSMGTWTYPNTDHTVQPLPPFDPNNDPVQLYIKYPPSSGELYQYDSGNRGSQIVTSGTPVTDPLRRVIYSPPSNSVTTVYGAFSYAASDGELSSLPGSVTMQVFLPAAPQLSQAKSQFISNGGFDLNFSGQAGATYSVWTSTNLANWEMLGFATTTSNGWFQVIDPNAASRPCQFYRAGAP